MNSQFCKVGKVKNFLKLEELQKLYSAFVEEAYNIMHTDGSLSDYLYFEAYKLRRQMVTVKSNEDFRADF
ncbi:Lacal_2735 family protein [Formosa sp. A9]|uniref:Lacal_2735 family protein n=1 Tax=Formosa sp. A9 TaxID=3442641 RepID=UPI003EBECFE9